MGCNWQWRLKSQKFCLQLRNETLLVTAEIHHPKLTDS